MDIRNEIESYIYFFAPKGVVVRTEEKANFIFFLSWPDSMNIPPVSILLKFNFEVTFEQQTIKLRKEILREISSYLDKKFIDLETLETKEICPLAWDVGFAGAQSNPKEILMLS